MVEIQEPVNLSHNDTYDTR